MKITKQIKLQHCFAEMFKLIGTDFSNNSRSLGAILYDLLKTYILYIVFVIAKLKIQLANIIIK